MREINDGLINRESRAYLMRVRIDAGEDSLRRRKECRSLHDRIFLLYKESLCNQLSATKPTGLSFSFSRVAKQIITGMNNHWKIAHIGDNTLCRGAIVHDRVERTRNTAIKQITWFNGNSEQAIFISSLVFATG